MVERRTSSRCRAISRRTSSTVARVTSVGRAVSTGVTATDSNRLITSAPVIPWSASASNVAPMLVDGASQHRGGGGAAGGGGRPRRCWRGTRTTRMPGSRGVRLRCRGRAVRCSARQPDRGPSSANRRRRVGPARSVRTAAYRPGPDHIAQYPAEEAEEADVGVEQLVGAVAHRATLWARCFRTITAAGEGSGTARCSATRAAASGPERTNFVVECRWERHSTTKFAAYRLGSHRPGGTRVGPCASMRPIPDIPRT